MEKKTLYIMTTTQHIDKRSARIYNRILTVVSSRVGNDDPGMMYKMELSFVSRNSQSEMWKEEKFYSDEQFAKQMQPLVEAKSRLHPVKGQATFPALVPDLSIFMQMSSHCTVLIGLVQIVWY